ncbi:MAG: hypothetical protein GY923_15430 [Aestuariibacter sp.]|nr:hypothetical protein [Aestuariibacter sp.]
MTIKKATPEQLRQWLKMRRESSTGPEEDEACQYDEFERRLNEYEKMTPEERVAANEDAIRRAREHYD